MFDRDVLGIAQTVHNMDAWKNPFAVEAASCTELCRSAREHAASHLMTEYLTNQEPHGRLCEDYLCSERFRRPCWALWPVQVIR
jgi:hypothetical protein